MTTAVAFTKKKNRGTENTRPRSLTMDVYVSSLETHQKILNSIRFYRAIARRCIGKIACAADATADIQITDAKIEKNEKGEETITEWGRVTVKPNNARSKLVLSALTGKEGKCFAYELREAVLKEWATSWKSFVWDSLRLDLEKAWKAPDPENPKANRKFLVAQGERGLPRFERIGIGHPVRTAHPKLEDHSIFLGWDKDIGTVEFKLSNLDGGRYFVWKNLRDETPGWIRGTVFLNERDGKLRVSISYHKPIEVKDVGLERVLKVVICPEDSPTTLFRLVGPNGAQTFETISNADVKGFLQQAEKRRLFLEDRRAACGSPRQPWGHRKAWLRNQDVLSSSTKARANGVKDRNHVWSRRICDYAVRWRCGTVKLVYDKDQIANMEWSWAMFERFLWYKIDEIGGTVVDYEDHPLVTPKKEPKE